VLIISHNYFPSEQALTSLLPLTSNYPTAQLLTWLFLVALAELQWPASLKKLQPMASVVTVATGNKVTY
jgi:hypothetical protein